MSQRAVTSTFLFMLLLVLSQVAIFNSVVHATKRCDFPAIINLGDSNSDTGGYAAGFFPPTSPYGDTYFHMPSRRFSVGRLIIDFIAEAFGLAFINAYLDSMGTNFSHGINFATSASTIRLPNRIIPNGGFSPFFLDLQYSQFEQFKSRSQMIRIEGGLFASLMPKGWYFSKALYTFDMGQNDLGEGFFSNFTIQQVNASIPDIINKFSANVKNIYCLGARYFWVHITGPIGCLPYVLTAFSSAEKDPADCLKPHNKVAQYFNLKLKEAIAQLRNELPSAAFTCLKYSLFDEPQNMGLSFHL